MEEAINILIVEDEAGMQKACRRVLEKQGFHVESAYSLNEGLQKILSASFDLVLLDVMLPDGQGIDLLPSIRARDRDSICIVMTGYGSIEIAVQAMKAGAYHFITKPFSSDLLLLTIKQGLEKRRLSHDVKNLQMFEHEVSQLWSLAKGELDGFDHLNKYFIGTAAFRLTIAHEFRAPITALLSFLILLSKGYVPAEEQGRIINRAIERGQALLDLVDDLMNLTTAREELSPGNLKLHHLAENLERVMPTLKAQAEEKGLQFIVDIKNRPLVEANPTLMDHLWTNLISNAIKYTLPGGVVTIVLEEQDGWAIGSIEDTGIGFSPQEQELIFHEFYRAPRAKEIERHGSGLGLSFVKRIIEGYQGTLEVNSEVGRGSCFIFKLPVVIADTT